ncbi:Peptidase inhibitor I78 family protein [Loktanella atrilutea]|uniref:Peptidase inhibitor I78 family protein n=1 Tax=Loktanella atrilutea TaxID=366533 RepID=A0A1M5BGE7_LOKAT|nr:I78 family peptidase inhibitor [Loktanella atrilutea]SHF41529.1 Peptidase inhibitor I78 family protein [Loktanella atrilutea]
MRIHVLTLIVPLLAACQPVATAPGASPAGTVPAGGDACGASAYADKIGGPMGDLRYPPEQEARLINPGEMTTLEYKPTRLNIEIDAAGRITGLRCG